MMCEHPHQWIHHLENAVGVFEKRGGAERFQCRGQILSCAAQPCDVFLLIPYDPKLYPSECEPLIMYSDKKKAA